MSLIYFPLTLILAATLSLSWFAITVLTRLDSRMFAPNLLRFGVAATLMLLFTLVTNRRVPQLSQKLLSSAIVVALFHFFLPCVLAFYALRTLSSTTAAILFSAVPFWMLILGLGDSFPSLVTLVKGFLGFAGGFALFYFGIEADNLLRGEVLTPFLLLMAASVIYAFGTGLAKKLFWFHAANDLAFWSLAITAGLFGIFALILGEKFERPPTLYLTYFGILTFGVTGLGTFFYRQIAVQSSYFNTRVLVIGTLLFSAGAGFVLWEETPLNFNTVLGVFLVLMGLWQIIPTERAIFWWTHFLHNSKRRGDRVSCFLEGFIKPLKGSMGKIEVTDISVGGLGFRSDTNYENGEAVIVSIPLAQGWTQISLECIVAHVSKNSHTEFPYAGGLSFTNLNSQTHQTLVEFLARVGADNEKKTAA